MPIAYFPIDTPRTLNGLGDFSSDVMKNVTTYAFGANNYGEAEYAKVLSVVNPQYQNYFSWVASGPTIAQNYENTRAQIEALVRANYPNVPAMISREISDKSYGTNKGVYTLKFGPKYDQKWEFSYDLTADQVFAQMRPYLSSYQGPTQTSIPLASSGNVANSVPANSVNSATSQVGSSSATTVNNFSASGSNGSNNIATTNSPGNYGGSLSWASYGGPSPATIWTPSGPSSNVSTGVANQAMEWIKANPILAVGILGLGFFAIKGLRNG